MYFHLQQHNTTRNNIVKEKLSSIKKSPAWKDNFFIFYLAIVFV